MDHSSYIKRLVAFIIDLIIVIPIISIFINYQQMPFNLTLLNYAIFYCIYSTIMDCSNQQGTIGKRILSLRVVSIKGEKIGIFHSSLRNGIKLIMIIPILFANFPYPNTILNPTFLDFYNRPVTVFGPYIVRFLLWTYLPTKFNKRAGMIHDLITRTICAEEK